ncbi:MAG TPA: type II toxin-antitoxin system VapC family toxin [Terracidiphilus sp.]|nr:type II toxin-antitoxin system VapC family toxin [Terracidiphilus sp.]
MSRIFFDTNLFIYMFEGLEPFRSQALAIRMRMVERGDQLATSALTLGEVLVKPTKLGQASLLDSYDRAIRAAAIIISFEPAVAWRYASLRATHTLRNADAIQLACASHFGVDLFITNDKELHKLNVPGIGFIAPLEKVPL